MLAATTDSLPRDDAAWGFEMKWDGMRAVVVVDQGRVQLTSRLGNDATARFPELEGLGEALEANAVVLDGEIVALDDEGRPSFERLQPRMQASTRHAVDRGMEHTPVALFLFDVLWLNGHSTTALPYRDRRALLDTLALTGRSWQTPPMTAGHGADALAAATQLGLEGLVMKRLDSPYLPGRRSDAWRKLKIARGQELVVGGWLSGKDGLSGRLGSLLVGYYDADGRLRYAGRAGSGITAERRDVLEARLAPLARSVTPFVDAPKLPGPHWVEPELVVDVAFHEWTSAGVLRAPRFKGLRDDKAARDVVRED